MFTDCWLKVLDSVNQVLAVLPDERKDEAVRRFEVEMMNLALVKDKGSPRNHSVIEKLNELQRKFPTYEGVVLDPSTNPQVNLRINRLES